jgi:hypothetical protein
MGESDPTSRLRLVYGDNNVVAGGTFTILKQDSVALGALQIRRGKLWKPICLNDGFGELESLLTCRSMDMEGVLSDTNYFNVGNTQKYINDHYRQQEGQSDQQGVNNNSGQNNYGQIKSGRLEI